MSSQDSGGLEEQGRGLRRLARALVADPATADDAVQEGYVLALDRQRTESTGWLRGVVRNKLRERRRSDARRAAREQHSAGPAAAASPADVAAQIDEQQRVMACLGRVPEPFRTAVWMRFILGQEPQAIADALGIPAATVRSRLHRGLAHLREQLDAAHGGDRRAWQVLLAPLVGDVPFAPPPPPVEAASQASIWGWTAAALVTVAVGWWVHATLGSRDPSPATTPVPLETPTATPTLTGRAHHETTPEQTTPAVHLEGVVRPQGGALPDDVRVYVIAKDAQFHTRPRAQTPVDEAGRFTLRVTDIAGHWIAAIAASGKAFGALDGDAWTAEQGLVVPLVHPRTRTVRVFDERGLFAPNVLVWVLPVQDELVRAWPRPGDARLSRFTEATNDDGVLTLQVPEGHPFRLRIRDRLPVVDRVVHPTEGDVDLRLVPGTSVRVRLDGWQVDQPRLHATLRNLEDAGAWRPSARVDRGVLAFQGVPQGRWQLELGSDSHRLRQAVTLHVSPSAGAEETEVALDRRHDIGHLEIELVDPYGVEASAGRLWNSGTWLRSGDRDGPTWHPRQPDAARDNRLTFENLVAGEHDVFLAKTFFGEVLSGAANDVRVVAGQTTRIRIDLQPAFERVLPELGTLRVAHRRLVHETLGELPILADWTRRAHPVGGLPLEGSTLGPYPTGRIVLEVWDPKGARTRIPLSALVSGR